MMGSTITPNLDPVQLDIAVTVLGALIASGWLRVSAPASVNFGFLHNAPGERRPPPA